MAHVSNTLFTEILELPFPGTFDLSKTLSEITLTTHSSAPQQKDERMSFAKQSENSGLAKPISATPNSLCQTAQEIPDDQVTSSESTPTTPKTGSPQLDQLLSDLEEMNFKFRTETPDPLLLDCSDGSSEGDQMCEFDDLSPEDQCHTEESDNLRVSVSSAMPLAEDTNLTNVAVIEPEHFQTSIQDEPEVVSLTPDLTKTSETSVPSSLDNCKDSPLSPAEFLSTPECPQRFCEVMASLNSSFPVDIFQSNTCDENATETLSSVSVAAKSPSDIPEEHLANLCEEDSTTDILQSPEKLESATSPKDSMGVTGEIATQSSHVKLTHLWEVTFVEAIQTEDISSQSLSDLTPETVTSARHFSFEEPMPYPSPGNLEASSDEDRPRTSGQHSEESLTPVESECFASHPTPAKPKAEMASSSSDEGYSIPSGYTEISSTTTSYTHMPPEYAEVVHSGADSPTLEYSDPEPFFDQCHTEESDNLRVSVSSAMPLAEDTNLTNVAVIESEHFQTSIQDEPEVVSLTPDLTKTSETSVPSSLDNCKDSPLSPAEFLSTPECPQRFCEVMASLNSSFPVDIFQSNTCDENATETLSSVSVAAKSPSDIPEEHLANLCEEDSTTDILENPEKLESATSPKDSMGVTGEIATQSSHVKLTHLWEVIFVEAIQTEDISSQSLSDLTLETVTSARHFSFEELMPYPSPGNLEASSDEDRPRTSGQHSEESLTPVDSECFASHPTPVKTKAEMASSSSDEGYSIPSGYTEISSTTTSYTHMPPEYAEVVHSGADSPTLEYSDPEPFFDQCHTEESDNLRVSVSSAMPLAEDTNLTNVAVIEPEHFQTSIQDEPEVVSLTPDLTKTSETSVPSSLDNCKDSPLSPAEFLSTPECPQRFCEVMASLNSSFPVDIFQSNTCDENATETLSSVSVAAKSPSDIPEEHLANLCEEDSTIDILQSPEKLESATSPKDSMGVTGEIATQSIQDKLTHLWEVTFVEAIQTEDISSQSLSDLTPETVTSARHFSFEEPMPYPSPGNLEASSDEDRPRTSGQHSEESLAPVESECFASHPTLVKPKAEMASSSSDEGYSIPSGYTEISSTTTSYTHMPPEYAEVVHSGADSPTLEYSDPEPFFDCIQAASDFSETDEPEASTRSNGDQPQGHLCHLRGLEKVNQKILLSSGSEDYEDAPFVQEPPYNVHEEKEASDEEFTLCEASQPPPVCEIGAYDDTVKFLTRDIVAELGSMSESSDDEFLTTRIVRRRVVIQADEMPDLPSQSVTEEKYKDENGHIVVKKVTRKIIRKCVSADGVEHEEVSSEGAPQASIRMTDGDGYSKVVKRTVLKSEGDHTEVTFAECGGFSASSQETAEGCKVSRVERTMVVEGERTMTHQGDPSLASDLPSAQKDFKQALGYISGFSRTELPHVVERETVKEDGTVVRRALMRKGRTHRRTVVKGAGKRKQVLLEQVDNPGRGSKPRDLQQHLHQLFHRYHDEEKDNDDDEEEDEEE